jgi:hypothetical protein
MKAKDVFSKDEETKTNAIKRMHKKYLHYTGLKPDKDETSSTITGDPQFELNILFDQIMGEIDER